MKICLIGSTKFLDLYRQVNRKLTLSGHVVYTVATISSSSAGEHVKAEDQAEITEDDKITLDLVHFLKMQAGGAVLIVTDETGYVGFSTKREIKWALMNGMAIYQMADLNMLCDLDQEYKDILEGLVP